MSGEGDYIITVRYGTVKLEPIKFKLVETLFPRTWWGGKRSEFSIETDYHTISGFLTRTDALGAIRTILSIGGDYKRLPDETR